MRAVGASRQEELLNDCVVSPQIFDHLVDRLCHLVVPYQHCLETKAGQRNVHLYLRGLLSHLDRTNAEEIAALVDVARLVMQEFIGMAPWDHCPLVQVLVGQVVHRLGEPDGVIAFDPSSFPKRGTHSVGGQPPVVWRLGQGRQLSGGGLHGVRVSPRSCLARFPLVPSQRVGMGQTTTTGRACARGRGVSHASRAVSGHARHVGCSGSARLGDRGLMCQHFSGQKISHSTELRGGTCHGSAKASGGEESAG